MSNNKRNTPSSQQTSASSKKSRMEGESKWTPEDIRKIIRPAKRVECFAAVLLGLLKNDIPQLSLKIEKPGELYCEISVESSVDGFAFYIEERDDREEDEGTTSIEFRLGDLLNKPGFDIFDEIHHLDEAISIFKEMLFQVQEVEVNMEGEGLHQLLPLLKGKKKNIIPCSAMQKLLQKKVFDLAFPFLKEAKLVDPFVPPLAINVQ